jgi:hypothetical protein
VRVEVWFQDEARIGQKNSLTRVWGQTGSRPAAPKDLGFATAYLFGAVCPSEGKSGGADHANLQYGGHESSSPRDQPPSRQRCPCRGDLGSCRLAPSQGLMVPDNITLLELPPYSPELNPVERVWHYLRSHWLANSVFSSLADIMVQPNLTEALR